MIAQQAKAEFWNVVDDCLIEIHGLRKMDAKRRSKDLRSRIERPPTGMSSEIFYHADPFDVACDLANNQLDVTQYRSQYNAILGRHNW